MIKPRLLIFIVAYHAQDTIEKVLLRIPSSLNKNYDVEVLVIDDASNDKTFEISHKISISGKLPFHTLVLFNPINQGYGGNQKIGYRYAIDNQFDYVALIHGDGQYAPECLPNLLHPFFDQDSDAVFGSRMFNARDALKGGMPYYKYIGNKILTKIQNALLNSSLTEFHSGYRIYKISALKQIPFELNTNDFHFDTEIIIQLLLSHKKIVELPIPTYYGDEICRVNGIRYAFDVVKSVILSRLQNLGILYSPQFDFSDGGTEQYQLKLGYLSPHSETVDAIKNGSTVLDLGAAGGYLGRYLTSKKDCKVTAVDFYPIANLDHLDNELLHDLNQSPPKLNYQSYDDILLLDVLEHLYNPEVFLNKLRIATQNSPNLRIFASTGNIGFFIPRFMLLFGQFNYGKRGLLDLTHTRLFTFHSFQELFLRNGFEIEVVKGIPGPYPLAIKNKFISHFLIGLNKLLINISKGLFSYQIFIVAKPLPTVSYLLTRSIQVTKLLEENLK